MPLTRAEIASVMVLPRYLRDVVPIAEMAERAARELAVERSLRETAERMCKRVQDERNAVYDASAAKALREAIFMLDRAAKERAAWARLVKAERAYIDSGATGDAERAIVRYAAAKQALRDLGVDVDALLAGKEET